MPLTDFGIGIKYRNIANQDFFDWRVEPRYIRNLSPSAWS